MADTGQGDKEIIQGCCCDTCKDGGSIRCSPGDGDNGEKKDGDDGPEDKQAGANALGNAVFIIESQPPMFGELVSILGEMPNFDFILVAINGKPSVIPLKSAVSLWKIVLEPYKDKLGLGINNLDFAVIKKLPEQFKGWTIITLNPNEYVNINSIGIPCKLARTVIGYDSWFFRHAFRMAQSKHYLLKRI